RFWTKALRDLGYVNYNEPFTKLFNQGMLHGEDGEKMSKSKGNVILPEVVSEKYGIDTARFFLMSLAAPDKPRDWSDKGVQGSLKFINKVIDYFDNVKIGKSDERTESKLNKTIKDVTEYIENFKYNLAVIKLRELFNFLPSKTSKDVLEKSLKLLHPFCPHITEELWEKIGNKNFITLEKWPVVDEKKINEKFEKEEEAIEKLGSDINYLKKLTGKKGKVYVYVLPNEIEFYKNFEGIELFAVNDKNKYDPENKSKKAKPGKPGIYLE
ncbi:MAG: class I tRNA ligase family protein, partial [archaeon]